MRFWNEISEKEGSAHVTKKARKATSFKTLLQSREKERDTKKLDGFDVRGGDRLQRSDLSQSRGDRRGTWQR